MDKHNLLRLADFLDGLDHAEFNMAFYASDAEGEYQRDPQASACNTVACAVGWGPTAGIALLPQENDWHLYSLRAFGMAEFSDEWLWCFSGSWSRIDNTPGGAAKRIRHLVATGCAPADSAMQANGLARYLFADMPRVAG